MLAGKMRIAILTTDNREHFKDYGCPRPYFGAAPEALLQGLALHEGIEVHVISCLRQPVLSPSKLANNIWYHALTVPKSGWMTTAYQGCIRAVRKKLKEIRPDIVHGQGTERDCAMEAVFSGFPNVITIHGNMAELARMYGARPFSYGWVAARFEDFALRKTQGVLCNSTYTSKLVVPRALKTWRVNNPIRESFFSPIHNRERRHTIRFINVGVISERKRQVEILQLFGKLRELNVQVSIEFIGSATYGKSYTETFLAAINEARSYASFTGPLSADKLIKKMDSADAMIHFPSEEAFGLVVAEALARNMKFFGSCVGGIKDIVRGVSGADLYDADNWGLIKEGIQSWVLRGGIMPESADSLMRQRYHPEIIAKQHEQIYLDLIQVKQ